MTLDVKGQVAVLTGAGGGIGRVIASRLASLGLKLVLLGGNNLTKLEETKALIEDKTEVVVLGGNLTDMNLIQTLADKAVGAYGKVDVLINNAGVAQNTSFENVSVEEYDKIMNINAKVPYFLTQKLLPTLKKSDMPTIINVASVVAKTGYPLQSVYSASKHALLGFSESLAKEVYRDGVRVHAICPGGVYTDMVKISRPDLSPDGMIMPEDIADVVEFFLTHRTNAVIDEISIHRVGKTPFSL